MLFILVGSMEGRRGLSLNLNTSAVVPSTQTRALPRHATTPNPQSFNPLSSNPKASRDREVSSQTKRGTDDSFWKVQVPLQCKTLIRARRRSPRGVVALAGARHNRNDAPRWSRRARLSLRGCSSCRTPRRRRGGRRPRACAISRAHRRPTGAVPRVGGVRLPYTPKPKTTMLDPRSDTLDPKL